MVVDGLYVRTLPSTRDNLLRGGEIAMLIGIREA